MKEVQLEKQQQEEEVEEENEGAEGRVLVQTQKEPPATNGNRT